jgi:hypothetical protein
VGNDSQEYQGAIGPEGYGKSSRRTLTSQKPNGSMIVDQRESGGGFLNGFESQNIIDAGSTC